MNISDFVLLPRLYCKYYNPEFDFILQKLHSALLGCF